METEQLSCVFRSPVIAWAACIAKNHHTIPVHLSPNQFSDSRWLKQGLVLRCLAQGDAANDPLAALSVSPLIQPVSESQYFLSQQQGCHSVTQSLLLWADQDSLLNLQSFLLFNGFFGNFCDLKGSGGSWAARDLFVASLMQSHRFKTGTEPS